MPIPVGHLESTDLTSTIHELLYKSTQTNAMDVKETVHTSKLLIDLPVNELDPGHYKPLFVLSQQLLRQLLQYREKYITGLRGAVEANAALEKRLREAKESAPATSRTAASGNACATSVNAMSDEELVNAAVKIQKTYRGYCVRKNLPSIRSGNTPAQHTPVPSQQEASSGVGPEAGVSGAPGKCDGAPPRVRRRRSRAQNNSGLSQQAAATKIQSQWRGRQARKEFDAMTAALASQPLDLPADLDEPNAIQGASELLADVHVSPAGVGSSGSGSGEGAATSVSTDADRSGSGTNAGAAMRSRRLAPLGPVNDAGRKKLPPL
eukprot:Rmarinus@m.11360